MATTKYKQQFESMLSKNAELFAQYKTLVEQAKKSPAKYKEELEEIKFKILRVIRKNEDMLCAKSENTKQFSNYSQNLADKFQEEIKTHFPSIYEAD